MGTPLISYALQGIPLSCGVRILPLVYIKESEFNSLISLGIKTLKEHCLLSGLYPISFSAHIPSDHAICVGQELISNLPEATFGAVSRLLPYSDRTARFACGTGEQVIQIRRRLLSIALCPTGMVTMDSVELANALDLSCIEAWAYLYKLSFSAEDQELVVSNYLELVADPESTGRVSRESVIELFNDRLSSWEKSFGPMWNSPDIRTIVPFYLR